ncbi:MAG TPA: cytochrome c biogenesis protein CcdA [Pyrinomonadaceae bacterium]|jgi:thiol:disulfide interchange protein DsbD
MRNKAKLFNQSKKYCKLAFSVIFCLLFVAGIYGQGPVAWTLNPGSAKVVKAGSKLEVRLSGNIGSGWYIYSLTQPSGGPNATRITVGSEPTFKLAGTIKAPSPKVKFDENFGINTETYVGNVTFTIPLQVSADALSEKQTIDINVRFQACNETTCLPPKTVKVSTGVEVLLATTSAAALPSPSPSVSPSATPTPMTSPTISANVNTNGDSKIIATANSNTQVIESQATNANESNQSITSSPTTTSSETDKKPAVNSTFSENTRNDLWSFIWIAISLGALSLLTPCVFPMIPITVSYFTNHSSHSRAKAVKLAAVYSLGIIATFTLLGMLLAIFVGAAGINLFAANPYINLLIAGIFLFFAFNLFGSYEIVIPTKVLTKLDNLTRSSEGDGSGIVGALLMGLTFTLTSFTCTSPFVGTILVSASQGSWQMPLVGMLAFSTVFALPFFVLALAPQLISQLPRAGGWMNSVKVSMGFLEVAAALKFLSNVDLVWKWGIFTRPVILAIWIALGIILSIYLLGKFQLSHDSKPERIGAFRLVSAVLSLAISFYLITGLFGSRLGELESFLPPATEDSSISERKGGAISESNKELNWITNDYNAALNRAKQENKSVFIDFTGYTCTNCRWMEANMFTKESVRRELDKYVRVQLYTDGEGYLYESFQQMQQEKFKTVALPFYAIVNANGNELATFAGLTRNEEEFVSFLRSGQKRF